MPVKKQGFLQALGVAVYCAFIGLVMSNGNKLFGKVDTALTPVFVLLLFSTSALICSTVVFYKPYKLFIKNLKKEALEVVISTALWLFVLLLVFLGAIIIFK